jgi:hypothetical protein
VDTTNVYWTNYDGTVMQCPVGGCGGKPTFVSYAVGAPYKITVDAQNVYWAVQDNGSMTGVVSCAIAGCAQNPALFAPSSAPMGVATFGGNVYWTDPATASVYTCPTSGCAGSPTVLATNQKGAMSIAVDGAAVYWTDYVGGGVSIDNRVMRCALAGCANAPTTLASSQDGPFDIAVDATNVYWTNMSGAAVMSCAVTGCSAPTVLAHLQGNPFPFGIATDGANVYWTNMGEGTVMKCATSGCGQAPTLMATNQNEPMGIAVDGASVYWAAHNALEIRKLPK